MITMVETILTAGITALAGVIVVLWKIVLRNFKDIKDRLSMCEEDREELWKEVRILLKEKAERQ